MFFPVADWFAAFLLTLAVEAPVVALLLRRTERSLVRLGVLFVFANLATHLVVWYVLTQLFVVGTVAYVVVAETGAIAAEAILYAAALRGVPVQRAIAVAVAANAMSFLAGRLVRNFWPELIG
jgi:hypothetical protein